MTHKRQSLTRRTTAEVGGNFRSALRNPHVSLPGVAAILCEVAGMIWPARASELRVLGKTLMAYAAVAAANTGQKNV